MGTYHARHRHFAAACAASGGRRRTGGVGWRHPPRRRRAQGHGVGRLCRARGLAGVARPGQQWRCGAHVLRLLRGELEIAMALTGYRDLSDCTEAIDTGHRLPPA